MLVLLASVAYGNLLWAASPGDVAAEQRTRAERLFYQAQELYDAGNTAAALELFNKSYTTFASPNSHLYVARCLRDLGRNAEAYAEYRAVLLESAEATDPDRYLQTIQAAVLERASLRPRLGALRLQMPADTKGLEVRVGGQLVPPAEYGQSVFVAPGAVMVSVSAPQREGFQRTYEVSAGERRTVAVELPSGQAAPRPADNVIEPAATPSKSSAATWRTLAIGSAGLGVAGFATWGIFGIQAASRYHKLEAECGGPCGSTHHDEIASGRQETLISQIGLGVGIAGLAGSLLAVGLGSRKKPTESTTTLRVSWTGTQLTCGGAF